MILRTNMSRIENLVRGIVDAAGAPGAAVALIVDGQPWSAGVGCASVDRPEPLAASARFGIYSVTKVVIATIVMKLAETGAIALDDPIQMSLPSLPIWAQVSLRQALNHTGGFPDYGGLPAYHEAVRDSPGTPWSDDVFLEKTLKNGMLFEPGHGWKYSNVGYMLLRQVIEQTCGMSFRQAVRRYLGSPLDLRDLDVAVSLEDMDGLTPGYNQRRDNAGLVNVIPGYHPGWVSHGLVVSTAVELATFMDALFAGSVVEPTSLREMLRAIPVDESHPWMTEPAYGLGLMIDPENRFGVVAGHTGGGPGYSTAAYHFPDVHGHGVTGVALVNRDGRDTATDIVFSMVDLLSTDVGHH